MARGNSHKNGSEKGGVVLKRHSGISLVRSDTLSVIPVFVSFFGLVSLHVIGFTSHSDHKLLEVFDVFSVSHIGGMFSFYVVFSALFARVGFLMLSGPVLHITVVMTWRYQKLRAILRRLAVWCRRSELFQVVATFAIGLVVFSRSYLRIDWASLITVVAIVTMGLGVYFLSRTALMHASRHVRGKTSKGSPRPLSVEAVDSIVVLELIRRPKQLLALLYLTLALISYGFGGMREQSLRLGDGWKIGEDRVILPVSDGYIAWDETLEQYKVLQEGVSSLSLFLPR